MTTPEEAVDAIDALVEAWGIHVETGEKTSEALCLTCDASVYWTASEPARPGEHHEGCGYLKAKATVALVRALLAERDALREQLAALEGHTHMVPAPRCGECHACQGIHCLIDHPGHSCAGRWMLQL